MALFSIGVGVLLIFLIFVMLAAARRSEMGMARAVGAKRGHLVQMFLYEGTAYALVSAAVGVVIGLGVSALIVAIVSRLFESLDLDFRLVTHFEPRSIVVAYCLGMAITFITVAFSANRVSRLNIVMAIRDLPEPLIPSYEPPFSTRFFGLPKAIVRPVIFLVRAVLSLVRLRWVGFLKNVALAIVWVVLFPIWIGDIVAALLRFVWPYLLRGWLTVIIGAGFIWWGLAIKRDAPFAAGSSLVIAGVGLMARRALQRTAMTPQTIDRVAFTATRLVMLAFWITPINILEPLTGQLEGDIEMMFVSGIFMVGAAVWTIMYNADLLVKALTSATGRMGKLRPVVVTAVAYPMSSKFRTGLTLAMFALVIFTMMVMSVLTESFSTSFSNDPETVAGGWDVRGDVSLSTPIDDIETAIADAPNLDAADLEAIGGYTRVEMEARQVDADKQEWSDHPVRAADEAFLKAAQYRLKLIADGYGTSADELWQKVIDEPNPESTDGQGWTT